MQSKESAGSMARKAEMRWKLGGTETSMPSSSAMVGGRIVQTVRAVAIKSQWKLESSENREMGQIQANSGTEKFFIFLSWTGFERLERVDPVIFITILNFKF